MPPGSAAGSPLKSLSMFVVVAVPAPMSMTLTAGCVLVFTFVVFAAQVPAGSTHAPTVTGSPQSVSRVQEPVQTPPALQVEAAPNAAHCAFDWQAPNWNTPTGPTGDAQVLVA